jgi:predicted nucleotidyltransferase
MTGNMRKGCGIMQQLDSSRIDIIKTYLIEKISPYLIYLYGSAAKGTMRKDSDVDIAFLSDTEHSAYDIFMMAQGLAGVLGRDVDLIDLKKASTVFKAQVVGTGKVIYCSDENRRMVFEMTSFKEYALLNEERQCILDKIKKRGTVYGR